MRLQGISKTVVVAALAAALGAPAVAAVSTGNRIYFILQALLMAVTAGTTALVARAWGAGDRAEAERVAKASLGLCAAISLVLTVPAFVWALPLASIFRLDAETIALSADFIRWLAPFQVALAALLALGVVLSALPWLARAPLAMAAGILVWGGVQGAFFTSITALATEQLPELRGVVTAMLSASTYVGVALYSVMAGALYQGPGYWAVGLASAAGCLVAAVLLARLPRAHG